jgi:multidrug efflux pump subunit AcrB
MSTFCAAIRGRASRRCSSPSKMPHRRRKFRTRGTRFARKWATSLIPCLREFKAYFNDEFGDVYVNLYALEGDGFSPAQLHDYAERLRTELLRVPDVNKVDFIADQEQRVYVEIANAQLAKLNLRPQQIADAVSAQNSVAGAGVVTTADDRVYVRPSGQFTDLAKLGDTLIRVNGRTIRLADIATISREYTDPPSEYMRFGNQTVLGIGVTMAPSGDVNALGKALDAETQRLRAVPVPYRSAQSVGASIAVDWFSASHWRCS